MSIMNLHRGHRLPCPSLPRHSVSPQTRVGDSALNRRRFESSIYVTCVSRQHVNASSKSQAELVVEKGLELFGEGQADKALQEFLRAQTLNPTEDEMRAAVYNSACAYVKLKRWQDASETLQRAINDYDVKLSVALKDDDLSQLRDRKEWNDLLGKVAGGIGNEGYAKLRAEASSPFQLFRLFVFGGLSAGASLGFLVSSARLVAAFNGVYELEETAKTFGINVACVVAFGFLFVRELNSRQKNVKMAEKEENLSMLQVSVSKDGDRTVPIAAFRGVYRPIIIAGSRGQVRKSLAKAAEYASLFVTRGIVVIPVILNDEDIDEKLQQLKDDQKQSKGFTVQAKNEAEQQPKRSKWKLFPHDIDEWKNWVRSLGVDDSGAMTQIYAQVQMDGVIKSSGIGAPPFDKLIADTPELDSLQTRLTDGRGIANQAKN
ncbi:Protein LOW PSII ACCUMULATION 1 [Picochlorum sp. SENEW3]|nr:Protein LOW PSII ACCUMULATION 1 [Picochlorum sp. SENEW3]